MLRGILRVLLPRPLHFLPDGGGAPGVLPDALPLVAAAPAEDQAMAPSPGLTRTASDAGLDAPPGSPSAVLALPGPEAVDGPSRGTRSKHKKQKLPETQGDVN